MNAHEVKDIIYENIWDSTQYDIRDNFQIDARHNVAVSNDIWLKVWSNGMSVRNDVTHHVRSHFPMNNK